MRFLFFMRAADHIQHHKLTRGTCAWFCNHWHNGDYSHRLLFFSRMLVRQDELDKDPTVRSR